KFLIYVFVKEKEILSNIKEKLGIDTLNDMQREMLNSINNRGDLILLSPTGSGKTLAFIAPMLKELKEPNGKLQAVIIAPSRELVIQIDSIVRAIATGHKVTCCYGGHRVADERQSLSVIPSIIVSTPGRLLDHINRNHIDVFNTRLLVLDEFDKSLELGFHDEMKRILRHMPNITRRTLTSATMIKDFPDFLRLYNERIINFLADKHELDSRLTVWSVRSDDKDKLQAALNLLHSIPTGRTIIFANHRESAERIHSFLVQHNVSAGLYHGGLDQQDREMAVTLFDNGSNLVLVTTDLGSRGLDIADVASIIHYHLPTSREIYTHRNGRTARISATGNVYVLLGPTEKVADYITFDKELPLGESASATSLTSAVASIYFNAGKKEKISRGDIVGFIANNGGITAQEIGSISLHDHYAIVALPRTKLHDIVRRLAPLKIKNKRVRITPMQ
ncbi:MAG: DEAD/DEAH box helicase, partial [Muribaculaceae bacterium]